MQGGTDLIEKVSKKQKDILIVQVGGGGIPAGLWAAEPVALQDREHPPPVLGLRVLPHLKVETHDAPLSQKITFPPGSMYNNNNKITITSCHKLWLTIPRRHWPMYLWNMRACNTNAVPQFLNFESKCSFVTYSWFPLGIPDICHFFSTGTIFG